MSPDQRTPRRLRVALVDTGYIPFPPPSSISWPSLTLMTQLGISLASRGHAVTFYAPQGSRLPRSRAHLQTTHLPSLRSYWRRMWGGTSPAPMDEQVVRTLWDQRLMAPLFVDAARGRYDVIHVQNQYPALPLTRFCPGVPTVFTLHSPITRWQARLMELYAVPHQWYVSISHAQRRFAPRLRYLATISNGVDPGRFPFSKQSGSALLCVGRIMPEKGTHLAIEIAERLGERLFIIGSIRDKDYFARAIKPRLNATISYLGTMPHRRLVPYYQNAKALLFPVTWDEAFGLVMIEAMACGTPVIGFRRGAVPEVVAHGKTGFVVRTLREMKAAVRRAPNISREACRAHVLQHFTLQRMIDAYEAAFRRAVEHGLLASPESPRTPSDIPRPSAEP